MPDYELTVIGTARETYRVTAKDSIAAKMAFNNGELTTPIVSEVEDADVIEVKEIHAGRPAPLMCWTVELPGDRAFDMFVANTPEVDKMVRELNLEMHGQTAYKLPDYITDSTA